MAFIYITGAPGVGKSTLQRILTEQGIETHDIDDPSLGGPHNKVTGDLVTIPPAESRSESWFDEHEWRIYRSALEALKAAATDKVVVVCGVAESDQEVVDLFDQVVYLSLDNSSLRQRLNNRADNDYGKNDFELTEILKRKQRLDALYLNSGAVVVDASQPAEEVVKEVMEHLL